MRLPHAQILACPSCQAALVVSIGERGSESDDVLTGRLDCLPCGRRYEIIRGIPRFVESSNYTSSFGFQWTRHAQTQRDGYSGQPVSESRFFGATKWPRRLEGQRILEIGGGAGRFTEQAARTGALVVSVDYSEAVEANHAAHSTQRNVLIVQADMHALPFFRGSFDKAFCFGVLQHTPDPECAFLAIPPMLKPEGELVIDVYRKSIATTVLHGKYYVRAFTRKMEPAKLYAAVSAWIDAVWPIARIIARVPRLGTAILHRLIVPSYTGLGLDDEILKEWARLDAFDMLSPHYDQPQRIRDVQRWFRRAGLTHTDIRRGYNGILGSGRLPATGSRPTVSDTLPS